MSVPLSPPKSEPRFRVAICGGGVGGLTLAITIGKYDPTIPIDLYEAHDSIYSAGVGITLWKNVHRVLIDLELFDDFKEIFSLHPSDGPSPKIRRADIREGGYVWFHRTDRHASYMHRQQMITILERHIPASCTLHPGKRLVKYKESDQEDGPISLEFADGTTTTTDVLIGADGVRSAVRKTMFETASKDNGPGDDKSYLKQFANPTFTGMFVYRCLVPAETLKKNDPENIALREFTTYIGKGRYFVTYPIAKGTIVNVVGMVCDPTLANTPYEGHWVSDATREELVGYFDHFEPNVREVVKLCEKPSKWAMHVLKPLPFCTRKRVALIGDAGHAMTPHLGAGAGQAVDDAYVLGRLIAHPLTTLYRVRAALHIYEELRFPFACSVASLSLSIGWMYALMAPGYYDGTRDKDDVDEHGIGAHERQGMEINRQEVVRRREFLNRGKNALKLWDDARAKLQELASDRCSPKL